MHEILCFYLDSRKGKMKIPFFQAIEAFYEEYSSVIISEGIFFFFLFTRAIAKCLVLVPLERDSTNSR